MLARLSAPVPQARAAVLLASLLWGTTGTVASFSQALSPLAIGAFAMGVGGLLQTLLAWRHIRQALVALQAQWPVLLTGALAIAVYPLAFYSSMRLAGVAIGTVISIGTAPFFTLLLECLIGQGGAVSRRWWLSFALGVTGLALLSLPGAAPASAPAPVTGTLLGLLAGFTYALYSWVAKRLIAGGIRSQAAMGSLFGLGALLLLPSLLLTGAHLLAPVGNLLVVGYMALVPMFLGYLAFGFGLRHVAASQATLLTLFEPVVAALLAVTVVGEPIPALGWLGMGLILGCLLLQAQGE